jgi:hypothetical protein
LIHNSSGGDLLNASSIDQAKLNFSKIINEDDEGETQAAQSTLGTMNKNMLKLQQQQQ